MDEERPDGVSIHAGFPNPASDKSLGSLDLGQLLITHPISTYLFRIQGQDWGEYGIFDGDVAIVDRALDPRKSDLVIWWREGEEGFGISSLRDTPANATVWGVVASTVHQFRKDE